MILQHTPRATRTLWGTELSGDYGDRDSERRLLREHGGLLDFSFIELVDCKGPDAASFLQGMLSADVVGLAEGSATPAWVLEVSGKIRFLLHVYKRAADHLTLACLPGEAEAVVTHLDRYLIMEKATLTHDRETAMLSLQGPEVEEPDSPGITSFPHDRCGLGGYDLLGDAETLRAFAKESEGQPIGFDALDHLRIQGFSAWYRRDIEPGTNPLVYGNTGISHTKGCFIGQETIAKTRDRGRPPRLLVQVSGQPGSRIETPTPLLVDGKEAGKITSVTRDEQPTIGLAILKAAHVALDELSDEHGNTWRITRRATYKAR